MINYNYLSCTDSEGNTKEINFCPTEQLPDDPMQTTMLLRVHKDPENNALLHVEPFEIYPVGSIYLSLSPIFNPHGIFPGRWERITDKFLLGAGAIPLNQSGGSTQHTLTIEEMPAHTHNYDVVKAATGTIVGSSTGGIVGQATIDAAVTDITGGTVEGKTKPFSIMPPYIAVNIWHRVE